MIWASSQRMSALSIDSRKLIATDELLSTLKKNKCLICFCGKQMSTFELIISRWTISHSNSISEEYKQNGDVFVTLSYWLLFYDSPVINHTAETGKKIWCCLFARDIVVYCMNCHCIVRMISLFNEKLWHTRRKWTANEWQRRSEGEVAKCVSRLYLYLAEC